MIESRVKEFSELAFDKKKEKVIAILSELRDNEGFFQKVLNIVQTNYNITSQVLVSIYKDILEFAEELKNIDKEGQIEVIERLKNKMDILKEQEKLEREQERPDDLLNLI